MRIVDEFMVPAGTVWVVTGFRYVLAVDEGWEDAGVTRVCVWSDSGGDGPRAEIYDEPHRHARRPAGLHRGLQMHEFTAEGLELVLLPGTYWIGPELSEAHGPGHAFWVTTRLDAVRRQGDLSWFSPNRGEAWFRHDAMGWEGDYWHQAFQVLGCDITAGATATASEKGAPVQTRSASPDDAAGPHAESSSIADGERRAIGGDILWDNNSLSNGVMARAISPPSFPDIRVADDFVVPKDGWVIRSFHLSIIEDGGWTDGGRLDFFLREHDGESGGPGALIAQGGGPFVKMATGRQLFGRNEYQYWMDDLDVILDEGRYWVGFRNSGGGGAGTNYWNTSDGRPDGPGTWGWFSLDAGNTWQPEGSGWDHGFEIRGALGSGGVSAPFSFEVTRGQLLSGGLLSLVESDDRRLTIRAIRPAKVSQPSVQVVAEGHAADIDVAQLSFRLEASVVLTPPERAVQWIDLYDFDRERWERMDTRDATRDDSVVDVVVEDDPARFIEQGTRLMRARVSFYDPGITAAAWFGLVDQTTWRVR